MTITHPYYISVFEMTESQYANVTGAAPTKNVRPKLLRLREVRGDDITWQSTVTAYCWPKSSSVLDGSLVAIIRNRTGILTVDLPTEAQWEMAAKGHASTPLYSGEQTTDSAMSRIARYEGNGSDGKGDASSRTLTHVGCYEPNAFGLFDVCGNAREWCLDVWADVLPEDSCTDPVGSQDVVIETVKDPYSTMSDKLTSSCRVVRGGGWYGVTWQKSSNAELVLLNDCDGAGIGLCRSASRAYGLSGSGYNGSSLMYTKNTLEGVRLVFQAE